MADAGQVMTNVEQPGKKGGCLKFIAIGCIVVVLLGAVGGFLAYRGVKGFVAGMVQEYTDDKPEQLPVVTVAQTEVDEVLSRANAFAAAIREGGASPALELSSQDINILIQNHPNWKEMAGKVHVAVEEDKISGQASIPLDNLGGMFKGRYLNGAATFSVQLSAGRLMIFLDSLSVRGKPLPDQIMTNLRGTNLAENANNNPESSQMFQKIESIDVQGGKVCIVPKQ